MNAMMTIIRSTKFIVLTAVVAAIAVFLFDQEPASATVPKPNQDIDLATYNDRPQGMWSDGTNFFVVESDSRWGGQYLIMQYRNSNGSFNADNDKELDSANSDPTGIWSDGTVAWVADEDDTKLYAYNLSDFSRLADRDIDLAGPNGHPRGLWGVRNTILVVDQDDAKVYAYSTEDGSRQEPREFDLHSDNGNPWGIWGEGLYVWISDLDDDMLYVYLRSPNVDSHGNRIESKEIRLPSYADNVRSIWSDGETIWALNKETHPYLYAMHFKGFRHTRDEIDITDVTAPGGLWTDGNTMWVADTGRTDHGMLLAYSLSDQTRDSSKDVQLGSDNKNPLSIWSDGETVWAVEDSSGNDFLYAYAMEPEAGEEGLLAPYKSVTLASNNADPRGTWSDGETIWVSDSQRDKLFAYGLSDRDRESSQDISLHSDNGHPGEIWSDGEIIWVLDTDDKQAYAYDLSDGSRKKGREFWTAPDNDDPDGGLTGYRLRFWVADGDDEKLYAYGGRNTPPSFGGASASFEFHRSVGAGDYIGTVPLVEDPDGDLVHYSLSSGGFGVFRLVSLTGELFVRDDAPAFVGGENYTLTVSVSDSKGNLDEFNGDADDAIDIPVHVFTNDDPEFTTPTGTTFTVAEDLTAAETIGQLDITDLDSDPLVYEYQIRPNNAFSISHGEIKLSSGHSLDYESTDSYAATVRIRDNKDKSGQTDFTWDDQIEFTIRVTNVDEDGEIILESAHPQVGIEMVATLRDPDGVDLSGSNQITWEVRRNVNDSWTDVSSTDTTSADFSYTPVTLDTGATLQFRATYKDESDGTQSKTIFANTANTVLSQSPTNSPPVWTETGTVTRSVNEDVAAGSNIGAPVTATDANDDTLTYLLVEYYNTGIFEIDSGSGQISLKDDQTLDHESVPTYWVRAIVFDGKDRFGNDDTDAERPAYFDSSKLVVINVANVEEDGSVHLSTDSPEVNEEIAASLREPDGTVSNLIWQWQIADSNPSNTWEDISGATSDAYTPSLGDLGKYLRARATYDDWDNTGKEAIGEAANPVSQPSNEPPEFNEGPTTTRSVNENAPARTRLGVAVAALDPESDPLTYSLATGPDSDKFVVESGTGQLEVAAGVQFDYETATDFEFEVVVQVSDGKAADHTQDTAIDDTITVTIELVNVDEPGEVAFSMTEPMVDEPLTATLTDGDGSVSGESWHWEKSQDGVTAWEAVNGTASDTYTPLQEDEGMYLRATVGYSDGEGLGKSAQGISSGAVQAEAEEESEDSNPSEDEQDDQGTTENDEDDQGTNGNEDSGGSSGQENQPETFTDVCRRDRSADLIAECVFSNFATTRVEHDGSYTIDWSEWDAEHPEVTGYTLFLQQLIYKFVYENGVEIDTSTLSDVYETCEFTDGSWDCQRPIRSNYFEDWAGNPVDPRTVVDNSDQTQWSYALDSPGRRTIEMTFQRWSGDASDPDNEPTPVTYKAMKFEMDLVHFKAHPSPERLGVVGINGANGFD